MANGPSFPKLAMAILSVVVGGVVWAVVHFLSRRQLANLRKCLEQRDDQLADAKAQLKRLEGDLESLEGERQARQEAVVVSLREQLATVQRQLMAAPRHAVLPSRESPRQAKFDDLFGSGSAIDGRLTEGEAGRLIVALHELTGLMKSKVGSGRPTPAIQPPSTFDCSNGRS